MSMLGARKAGCAWVAAACSIFAPVAVADENAVPTQLGDVVVNARHRDEYAVDVPVSATAVYGEALNRLRADSVRDLQAWLPGLDVQYADPRNTQFAVRGIGNNPVREGIESSVGLYLDEVYLGRQGMTALDLVDVERIDLLRGPQGTLFGKNATAGVLHIHTRAPGFVPEARAEASRSSRDGMRLRATASGPLADTAAARLSGYVTREDGYVLNLHDDRMLNSVDRRGLRGQLLLDPHTDWSLRLTADWHQEEDTQGTMVLTGIGPAPSGFRNLQQGADRTGKGPLPLDPMRYETNLDGEHYLSSETGGFSAHARYAMEGWEFASISAWRYWDYVPHPDIDDSPMDIFQNWATSVRQRQWSQEFRFASASGEAVDWTAGVFLLGQDTRTRFVLHYGDDADVTLLPFPYNALPLNVLDGLITESRGGVESDSAALFAQADWHITDDLDLSFGLRGTWEQRSGRVVRDPPEARPSLIPQVNDTREGLFGAYDSDDDGGLRESDFGPSALLALGWRFDEGLLGYLRFGYSEKSGGFNANAPGSAPSLGTVALRFDPERAASAEAGIKLAAPGGRVQAEAAVFLNRVRDYQTSRVYWPDGQIGPSILTGNIGEVESRGLEWNLRWLAVRGLELGFNGAWIDAYYRDFANAPCPAEANPDPPDSCDLTGQSVQGTPRWALNALARYGWNWSGRLVQSVDATYAWRSERQGDLSNSIYNHLPAYGLLHAATELQWDTGRSRIRVSLWGRNLLDERHLLFGRSAIQSAYAAAPGVPRTIGVSLGCDW